MLVTSGESTVIPDPFSTGNAPPLRGVVASISFQANRDGCKFAMDPFKGINGRRGGGRPNESFCGAWLLFNPVRTLRRGLAVCGVGVVGSSAISADDGSHKKQGYRYCVVS